MRPYIITCDFSIEFSTLLIRKSTFQNNVKKRKLNTAYQRNFLNFLNRRFIMKISFKSKTLLAIAGFIITQGSVVSAAPTLNPIDDLIPLPFFSYDVKTFHSSECQPYYGNTSGDFNYYVNRVQNISNGYRRVTCPIVRDNTINTSGTKGVEVFVHNKVAGQTLSCTLFSHDSQGYFVASDYEATTTVGRQALKLDVNLSKNMGNYSLYCYMPSGTSVFSYKVKEWNTNDTRRTDWNN